MHRALATLTAGLILAGCADSTAPEQSQLITSLPRQLSTTEQSIAQSTPSFGVALLKALNTAYADSNVFISPLSASMALGMAMNGANGTTFGEMRTTLGLPDRPLAELNGGYKELIALLRGLDAKVDFRIANSVWYDRAFESYIETAFLNDTKNFFDATVTPLDFTSPSAVSAINTWVNTNTNGKIPTILERIPPQMVMYLINAIYFKGSWRDAFDPKQTASATFTTERGQRVQVPTMHRNGKFRLATGPGNVQVIELPYGGDAYAMTILLPPEGTSINTFVAGLDIARWHALMQLPVAVSMDLYLPKFKLEWQATLNDYLRSMGMRQAFVDGGADFTRLSSLRGRDLFISEVKQKTFVDVNEEGTEAAAVTSVGVGVTSLPPQVRVNRPFVFALRERLSGTVLFMGKIVRP